MTFNERVERHVRAAREKARADAYRLHQQMAEERTREQERQRFASRLRVLRAIYTRGWFWPGED